MFRVVLTLSASALPSFSASLASVLALLAVAGRPVAWEPVPASVLPAPSLIELPSTVPGTRADSYDHDCARVYWRGQARIAGLAELEPSREVGLANAQRSHSLRSRCRDGAAHAALIVDAHGSHRIVGAPACDLSQMNQAKAIVLVAFGPS